MWGTGKEPKMVTFSPLKVSFHYVKVKLVFKT